ncbi:rhsC in rhs element domain protein, partial [Escherichia coli DEC9A]
RREYDESGRLIQETPLTAISPATVMIIHTVTYPAQRKMPPAAGKP